MKPEDQPLIVNVKSVTSTSEPMLNVVFVTPNVYHASIMLITVLNVMLPECQTLNHFAHVLLVNSI